MKTSVTLIVACLAITLGAVAWGSSKQQSDNSTGKWEYKVVSHVSLAGIKSMDDFWEKGFGAVSYEGSEKINAEIASHINELGDQGWDLICYGKEIGFVFKRLK